MVAGALAQVQAPRDVAGGVGALVAEAPAKSARRAVARGAAARGRPAPSAGREAGVGDALVPDAGAPPFRDAELERDVGAAPAEDDAACQQMRHANGEGPRGAGESGLHRYEKWRVVATIAGAGSAEVVQ